MCIVLLLPLPRRRRTRESLLLEVLGLSQRLSLFRELVVAGRRAVEVLA